MSDAVCPHCGEPHAPGSKDCLARWSGKKLASRYHVGKVLGTGGMGAVHEAIRTSDGLKVALKVLHPRYAKDEVVIERFFREGREAGAIDHPGIVKIHEVGTAEDGAPFLAMEMLEGETLHETIVKRGRLPPAEAAGWIIEALEALHAAHQRGIVHRDLKPANLFLARQADGTRRLKILDFGLARVARETETRLTKTGVVMGTVAYMSPEQIRDFKGTDARSDLYSLGITLFELLTGKTPVHGLLQHQAVLRIATGSSDRSPGALVSGIPPELDAVVQRSLAPTPETRFQNAPAMADALRPFVLERPSEGRRTGPIADARAIGTAATTAMESQQALTPPAFAAVGPTAPRSPDLAHAQTDLGRTMLAHDVRAALGSPPPLAAAAPGVGPAAAAHAPGFAPAPGGTPLPGGAAYTPAPAGRAAGSKSSSTWLLAGLAGAALIVLVTVVVIVVASSTEPTPTQPTWQDPQPQYPYPQQPVYPQQPGYPQQPVYPQQPGYPGQPGYPQQPYPQQPTYPQQPAQPDFPASLTPQ